MVQICVLFNTISLTKKITTSFANKPSLPTLDNTLYFSDSIMLPSNMINNNLNYNNRYIILYKLDDFIRIFAHF